MQEVEALCDQVLIIDGGKMIMHDTLAQLAAQRGERIVVAFKEEIAPKDLATVPGVAHVHALSKRKYSVCISATGEDVREAISHFARERNLTLLGLSQERDSLEETFQQLTGQLPAEG
jgi:ABC-2 type transport system ATP-binding protein